MEACACWYSRGRGASCAPPVVPLRGRQCLACRKVAGWRNRVFGHLRYLCRNHSGDLQRTMILRIWLLMLLLFVQAQARPRRHTRVHKPPAFPVAFVPSRDNLIAQNAVANSLGLRRIADD